VQAISARGGAVGVAAPGYWPGNRLCTSAAEIGASDWLVSSTE